MEPMKHVPHVVPPLDRRSFLGLSLGSAAGLAAATAFSPALTRARPPGDVPPGKPRHLICSRKVDVALIRRVDQAISRLRFDQVK